MLFAVIKKQWSLKHNILSNLLCFDYGNFFQKLMIKTLQIKLVSSNSLYYFINLVVISSDFLFGESVYLYFPILFQNDYDTTRLIIEDKKDSACTVQIAAV